MSPREKLLAAFDAWRRFGEPALNALTWAAVRELQEQLPPPGPDPLEVEIASWFPESEAHPWG